MNMWINGVLRPYYFCTARLYWPGDNLGQWDEVRILLWIVPLVQDQSLDLLTSSTPHSDDSHHDYGHTYNEEHIQLWNETRDEMNEWKKLSKKNTISRWTGVSEVVLQCHFYLSMVGNILKHGKTAKKSNSMELQAIGQCLWQWKISVLPCTRDCNHETILYLLMLVLDRNPANSIHTLWLGTHHSPVYGRAPSI